MRATRDLCELASEMKNLKAFVYVSTAYCNHRNGSLDDMQTKRIREELYPIAYDFQELIRTAEAIDEYQLNALWKL